MTDQSCIRYAGFPEFECAVRLTQNVNGEARSRLYPEVSHGADTGEGIHVSSIVPQYVGVIWLYLLADVLSAYPQERKLGGMRSAACAVSVGLRPLSSFHLAAVFDV